LIPTARVTMIYGLGAFDSYCQGYNDIWIRRV